VRQKSSSLKFFAVFSATIRNFNLKHYRFIYWNVLHLPAKWKWRSCRLFDMAAYRFFSIKKCSN